MNTKILDQLYNANILLVTKEDLLNKGFNFSEFFSTRSSEHFFDNEETSFEYKDFVCGSYYVKIIWVNKQIDGVYVRLYFQLIKFGLDKEILYHIEHSESLLSKRKSNAGLWWGYTFESEIENKELASIYYDKYYANEVEIENFIHQLKTSVNSLCNTKLYFEEVLKKMEVKKSVEDRACEE